MTQRSGEAMWTAGKATYTPMAGRGLKRARRTSKEENWEAGGRGGDDLSVCLLGPHKNRRNFHEAFVLIRDEDDAPAPYAFAVTPLPWNALQWFHVATKRVFRHFIQAFEDKSPVIPRGIAKLFCGGS
jgi:hypothetical protein